MNYFPLIVTMHVLGIVLWLGGLWSASRLMLLQLDSDQPSGRLPEAALKLFRSVSGHGMMLAVLGGIGLVGLRPGFYFKQGWFHAKLTLVVAAIVIHFLLRKQASKLESDPASASRSAVSGLSMAVAATAGAIFYLVFTQP